MAHYYEIKRWRDKSRKIADEEYLCLPRPLNELTPDDDYLLLICRSLDSPEIKSEAVYNSFLRYPGDFEAKEISPQQIIEQFFPCGNSFSQHNKKKCAFFKTSFSIPLPKNNSYKPVRPAFLFSLPKFFRLLFHLF
jgi:hypothetical protein